MEANKIKEMQMAEQGRQNLLLQKQELQMELAETKAAMKEIENSPEVYKLIGQLLIKTKKDNVKEDLEKKEKFIESRIDLLDKQFKSLSEKSSEQKD